MPEVSGRDDAGNPVEPHDIPWLVEAESRSFRLEKFFTDFGVERERGEEVSGAVKQ